MAYVARKVRRRTRRGELSDHDRHFLLTGWSLQNNLNRPLQNARELWGQYRDELLAYWQQDPATWTIPDGSSVWHWPKPAGPGTLPWAAKEFDF